MPETAREFRLHRSRRRPRHPAEVTADRLGDHVDRWFDKTDGATRDAISLVRDWLDRRAEEARNA